MCDMTCSNAWHDSGLFGCISSLFSVKRISRTHSSVRHDSFECVTLDSFCCVTCRVLMRHDRLLLNEFTNEFVTQSYVTRPSLCVTLDSFQWVHEWVRDSVICDTTLTMRHVRLLLNEFTNEFVTHSYVTRPSLCVTLDSFSMSSRMSSWLSHMWHDPHYASR